MEMSYRVFDMEMLYHASEMNCFLLFLIRNIKNRSNQHDAKKGSHAHERHQEPESRICHYWIFPVQARIANI